MYSWPMDLPLTCSSLCPNHKPIITSSKRPKELSQTTQPWPQLNFFQFSPGDSIAAKNNVLLSSYSKSNSLDQTLTFFSLLHHRDTVTWNTILSACCRHRRFKTALSLFVEMLQISCPPDTLTFRSVLEACANTNSLSLTLQVHAYIAKLEGLCSLDLIVNTRLIGLYSGFRLTQIAHNLFDRIPSRDVVVFAAMMTGYNEAGQYQETLRLFSNLVESESVMVNEFAFTCALSASAALRSLLVGRQIHACIVKASLQSDVYIATSLIKMYMECDRIKCSKMAFSQISMPNVASWNAVMCGNLSQDEVLQLFSRMRLSDVSPDSVTFAIVIRACRCVTLSVVQQIHGLVMKIMKEEMDVFVGGALFDKYVDLGSVHDAAKVFNEIHTKDITCFNLAIQGFARNGYGTEAVSLFYKVLQKGLELNEATLTSLAVSINGPSHGKQLHALVIKFGFCGGNGDGGASIASLLVTMYANNSCLQDAIQLFHQIHCPDLVLWTSLISGLSQSGECQEALKFYVIMASEGLVEPPNHYTFSSLLHSCAHLTALEEGKQLHAQIIKSHSNIEKDLFVASGLIDMYAKCGSIAEATKLFEKMPEHDLASWNAMITGLAQHGSAKRAIETFEELLNQRNVEPNHITYLGVLSACRHGGLVQEGYQYFQLINTPSVDHHACLIDLVGRAGRLEEARNLIEEMPFDPNEIIWSSLLVASRIHGNVEMGEYSAKHLLQLNQKDPGTYVELSNIYSAAGRWKDATKVRKLMKDRGISKNPGLSWLSIKGRTHIFYADKG